MTVKHTGPKELFQIIVPKPRVELTLAQLLRKNGCNVGLELAKPRLRIAMSKRCWVGLLIVVAVMTGWTDPASGRRTRQPHRHRRPVPDAYVRPSNPDAPPAGPFKSALLVDAATGKVLFEKDASKPWPPASMVKMMVALVSLEAVRAGEVRLDQPVRASLLAASTGGTRVALRLGEILPLNELLKAMLVASANDASVAVAEAVAGNSEAMVGRMNRRARELGMTETVYRTVNGLPPRRRGVPPDITSADDLAILARKLLEYPEILQYSAQSEVPFRNGLVRLRNTNHLIGRMSGADGLKTGYIRLAGFNLTATAMRGDMRLVAVVLGCPTLRSRFDVAEALLEWGFSHYAKLNVVRTGDLTVLSQLPSLVRAPISKNQHIGDIIVHDDDGIHGVIPAVSPLDVDSHTSFFADTISQ